MTSARTPLPIDLVALVSFGVVNARATREWVSSIAAMRTTSCVLDGQATDQIPPSTARSGPFM